MTKKKIPAKPSKQSDAIEGTWKLSQNKPAQARSGAIQGIAQGGVGNEIAFVTAQMERCLALDGPPTDGEKE